MLPSVGETRDQRKRAIPLPAMRVLLLRDIEFVPELEVQRDIEPACHVNLCATTRDESDDHVVTVREAVAGRMGVEGLVAAVARESSKPAETGDLG